MQISPSRKAIKHYLLMLLIVLFLIINLNAQIQISCGNCSRSTLCGAVNLCAKYYGQGFTGQQLCVASCDQYPIIYYPSYCQKDSLDNNCQQTCCVSTQRTTTAEKKCSALLNSKFNSTTYCANILTNAAGTGIIAGSLILLIILAVVVCIIHEKCCQHSDKPKPYVPKRQIKRDLYEYPRIINNQGQQEDMMKNGNNQEQLNEFNKTDQNFLKNRSNKTRIKKQTFE